LTYSGASLLSEAQCWCEFHFPPVYFFSATVIDWLGVERTANAPESDGHAPNYFWIKYSASNYRSAVAFLFEQPSNADLRSMVSEHDVHLDR
jgi:hypothetical protein